MNISIDDNVYVKDVFRYCPHYDEIVKFNYNYDDNLTDKIINWYRNIVFSFDNSDISSLNLLLKIDSSVYFYITNRIFRKKIKEELSNNLNMLENKQFANFIINYVSDYQNREILEYENSKWL